jgi:uncharacterized protein (DUF1330 family)
MKSNYKLMLTAVGAFALGALAIQGLHAQMKPPAYFIGEISVKDENNYTSEFLPLARKSIAEGGGKYVAGGFNKTVAFSGGPPPNRVVIIQFENMDKAKAWYDSPAQKDSHKIGDKFAAFREFIVEGVEQSNFPQRGSEPRDSFTHIKGPWQRGSLRHSAEDAGGL